MGALDLYPTNRVETRAKSGRRAPSLDVVALSEEGGPAGGLLGRIAAIAPSLKASDSRIAAVILESPIDLLDASVTEFAETVKVSASTVVRFAQKLGFKGYQHMKLAVAHDIGRSDSLQVGDLSKATLPESLLAASIEASAATISGIRSTMNIDAFGRALEALDTSSRVLVCGVGSSAGIAQDAGYRFAAIGLRAEAPADGHMQHLQARLLRPGSVLVAISYSGATAEILEDVELASEGGATTIAITGHLRSPLTETADIALVTGIPRGFVIRGEAMASRLAMLALVDALSVGIVLGNQERSSSALDAVDAVAAKHRV